MKLFIVFLLGLMMQGEYDKSLEKKLDKALKKSFELAEIKREHIQMDEDHERPEPGLRLFSLAGHQGRVGYVIVTTAQGRYDYFDYCVIYNLDLTIRQVVVLTYRSDHGYEIAGKKWLSQFQGRDGCELVYGSDIDAIGGATLSASSITKDVGYLCHMLRSLSESGKLK